MRPATLAGSMKLPIERVNVAALKHYMTLSYLPMGAEEPIALECFRQSTGYLEVPRQFGIAYCHREGIDYEDHTSQGVAVTFPKVPVPRDYQVGPLQSISECFETYYDFIFRARTGWGKTLGALLIASRLGVSTLIVVDQENLKDQWIASLVNHFGFSKEDVGVIQGKKCNYKGKAVTIAMVQTLSQKQFPQEVYDYFGFLVVDEVHIIGAPTFSSVLLQFSAAYRFGVSATPKRRDGLQKVLDYNLGRVRVYVEDEHDRSSVYVMEHDTVYSWFANTSPKVGRFITEIAEDGSRNLLLAEAVMALYDTGRDILVLSDRIEQLQQLRSLCYYMGLPEEEAGLYAGYRLEYGYEKDPAPARRPKGYERGAEYTPIILKSISKRMKKSELKQIKENARVIFSTYGMFSKGVDEARLNGGVDATPRSRAEQVHGRILRQVAGKMRSIWVTVCDTSSYRSMFSLTGRLADYVKNNADVHRWSPEIGKIPCTANQIKTEAFEAVKRLKSLRIETSPDGLNTLATPSQQIEAVRQRVSGTKAPARTRRS